MILAVEIVVVFISHPVILSYAEPNHAKSNKLNFYSNESFRETTKEFWNVFQSFIFAQNFNPKQKVKCALQK